VNRNIIKAGACVMALGITAAPAIAATGHHHRAAGSSRLDDGKALLPKARITEQQAIAAAQGAASGALDEVDLEYHAGTLVFNVDVGSKDVKVDASSGKVLAADQDD
jgi:uncharacterized membrane protein YkoI